MSSEAFVTLATTDGYALGALVVAQSLRKVGTQRQLVVMISKNLSDLMRRTLETSFDEVVVVEELDSHDDKHLGLLARPELGVTFTKVNCWLLEKYSKCVFLDADTVILRNIDDLFEREEFSAAPDAGWPDCFNSGVFVYRPSKETFRKLVQFASQQDASFDGGDQGLLNNFFSNWRSSDISRHIPFTYNVTSNTFYSYIPAVLKFRDDIRVVHFAGALKPWHLTFNPKNEQLSGNLQGQHEIQKQFLLKWWRIMYERVWPQLSKNNQPFEPSQSTFIERRSVSVMNQFSIISELNVTKVKEKCLLFENRSFPSIIDDLFNDISIREKLKRKFSTEKILPHSAIFHIRHGSAKPFHINQPKHVDYDSLNYDDHRQYLTSEEILSLFSNDNKQNHTMDQTTENLLSGGSDLTYGSLTCSPGIRNGSVAHRRAWESGQIDYQGRDSFSNIQQQLEKKCAEQPQPYHPAQDSAQSSSETAAPAVAENKQKESTE